ncbi:MAG: TlpA disulfide reductase family protein [Roseicyclus sp.]
MRSLIERRVAVCIALFLVWPGSATADSLPRLFSETSQYISLRPLTTAPNMQLLDTSGSPVRLSDFMERPVVLNFWATWCEPCLREMASLDRLAYQAESLGIVVLAVSIDEDGMTSVATFLRGNAITDLKVLLDPNLDIAFIERENARRDALGIYGLPITYFIDSAGQVRGYITGAVDWSDSEARRFLAHLKGITKS